MKKLVIGLLVLVMLSYAGCQILYPSRSVNFRMTFEVETPEGIKTGSGVQRAVYFKEPALFGAPGGGSAVWGDAIEVNLGPRGSLFAVLGKAEPTQHVLLKALAPNLSTMWGSAESIRSIGRISGKADVPLRQIPFLVRFRDINDPLTVEMVDPMSLSSSFGQGVSLKSVFIETTTDPVTRGIELKLPWLAALKGGYLDGGFSSRNAPLGLFGGNFSSGG